MRWELLLTTLFAALALSIQPVSAQIEDDDEDAPSGIEDDESGIEDDESGIEDDESGIEDDEEPPAPVEGEEIPTEAGPSDPDAPVDPNALAPPELIDFVAAEYPEAAREQNIQGAVGLQITILETGAVTDVEVVRPLGHGLDEAAVAAVEQFRFRPATRGGVPIAARVTYDYTFELTEQVEVIEEPEPEEIPEGTPGEFQGVVLDSDSGDPVEGVEVIIGNDSGTVAERLMSGADGRFRFQGMPPGRYEVRLAKEGYGTSVSSEEVFPGEISDATYRLSIREEGDADEIEFGATSYVDPPPREVVRRTIPREHLTRIAGTRGDALRAVELMPGVGRPPFGIGALLVRGSAPGDSEVIMDGIPIPQLYHFGGLTSFMNSRLIDRLDFYPGNFSPRFGRKMGGILEVASRDPNQEQWGGVVDLNAIDVSILAEGPIGDNVAVAVGARRSFVDLWLPEVIPADTFGAFAAPVYWDYQAFLTWRPTDVDKIKFSVYGSSDAFSLVLSDEDAEDPDNQLSLDLATSFHRGVIAWEHQYGDSVTQTITVAAGQTSTAFGFGPDLRFEGNFTQLYGRAEWRFRPHPKFSVIAGMDIALTPLTIEFVGPPPQQQEGNPGGGPGGGGSDDNVLFGVDATAYRPAAYVEGEMRPFEWLQVIWGLRLDWYREIGEWSVDPRMTMVVQASDEWRFKGGIGSYSQPPEFQESSDGLGNPNLEAIRSIHTGLGAEYIPTPGLTFGVEGFYKHLTNRVVGTSDESRFDNAGIGHIYGLEMLAKYQIPGPFFGYFSYTLMRSERRDRPGEQFRLFDFDQTHILTIAAGLRLGGGWEFGATFRLASGNPYTPVTGSVYDTVRDTYEQLFGEINSDRNPTFHRLDLRVEKKWEWELFKLAVFLDVQNVYNNTNPEGFFYSYDGRERSQINGLPIIPAIGIRGEM